MSSPYEGQKGSIHAAAQYLGYSLQTTRFLMRLLDAEPEWTISLEVFEDVGVETSEGNRIAEQDKNVSKKNPVSNRAIDLWKTFANWVTAVEAGELNPEKTVFELYISQAKTGAIVDTFFRAQSETEAEVALQNAINELWGKSPNYPLRPSLSKSIAPYVKKVFEADKKVVCKILQNFQLSCGEESPHADLRKRLKKQWIPSELVDDLLLYALGWVKEQTDVLIEQQKPACVSSELFRQTMISFIRKHDNRTILRTYASKPTKKEIQEDLKIGIYVRQLDIIEESDDEKIRAVTDYLRASADRTHWSEKGLVQKTSFEEFYDNLVRTWRNLKRKAEISLYSRSDVKKGQYLYAECSSHYATIEGLQVPGHFTPGSFHALSDEKVVGWHPDYARKLGIAHDERKK